MVYDTNYQPFGPAHGESGSEEFKYTGKREDTTGLYYFGARYYDPNVGRFITEDPVLGEFDDPQGLNSYVYCRNNPLKYTDPDGRILWNILIGTGAGAAIGGTWYSLTHIRTFKRHEFFAAIGSGAVSGFVLSMGGPALTWVGDLALKASAATLSWSAETMVSGMLGGPVEPQEPIEIVSDIALSTGISFSAGQTFKHVPQLKGVTEYVENQIGEISPLFTEELPILCYAGNPPTKTIANMLGSSVPPRIVGYAIKEFIDIWWDIPIRSTQNSHNTQMIELND